MTDLSPGASLAWKIAAAETAESRHAWIEPAHLLIGVLSLQKLNQLPESYARLEAEDRRAVDQESRLLADVLTQAALDASVWRRRLRSRLGLGGQDPGGKTVSRSPACKRAFERASQLAGAGATSSLCLLAALVATGDGIIKASLEAEGVRPEALRAQALAAQRRAPSQRTEAPLPAPVVTNPPDPESHGHDATRASSQAPVGSGEPPPGVRRGRGAELQSFLRTRLFGQDHVVRRVAEQLTLALAESPASGGPLAVLLFLGPRGVGKSELARLLAEFRSGNQAGLLCFDLGEFGEPGSNQQAASQFSRCLRAPAAVVLMEQADKAHPRVLDSLARAFAVGRLAGARGPVVVLTTTLADDVLEGGALAAARRIFPNELLRAVDEILIFRTLTEEDALGAVQPMLAAATTALWRRQGVRLTIETDAMRLMAQAGLVPGQGIRGLKGAVERFLDEPVAELASANRLAWHPVWRLVRAGATTRLLPASGGPGGREGPG